MECSCEIDMESYGNGPSAFTEIDRVARKEHKCCECGRVIQKGETYRYESGIWDRKAETYKTCADCLSVRDAFFCTFWFGQVWKDFFDRMNECGWELSMPLLAKVTKAAREEICEHWEEYWEEYELENPLRLALRVDARCMKNKRYHFKPWVIARRRDVKKMTDNYYWG